MDTRKAYATFLLGKTYIGHLFSRLAIWKRGQGYSAFKEKYRADNFFELTPEERKSFPNFQKCFNCGVCIPSCLFSVDLFHDELPDPESYACSLSRPLPDLWTASDNIYKCTCCAACEDVCPQGVPITKIVRFVRRKIEQIAPELVPYKVYMENIEKEQNIFGERPAPFVYTARQKPAYLLYMGCLYSTKERETGQKIVSLLDKANLDFTILKEETCCGRPIDINGNCSDGDLKRITEMNIKTIIAPCAQCYSSLKERLGDDLNILHITEFLSETKFKIKAKSNISYFDPCAGSGVGILYPEMAGGVAKERLKPFKEAGVEILLTECSYCLQNLRRGVSKKDKMKVYSLSEYLYMSEI
ncbi:MAG: (Fe-S)-binding protein [Nitrospirae bacterium]|nr:(Fe-S)-binding protein [Nitrospirota bacterium]